jgi:hypothetical protein
MKKCLLIIILLLLFQSLSLSQTNVDNLDGWQKTERCGATFLLPSDMIAPLKGQLGMHSCVEVYENSTMSIFIGTDSFPPFGSGEPSISKFKEYKKKPEFKRSKTKIGTRKAIIVTYYDGSNEEKFYYQAAFSIFAKGGFRMHISMKNAEDKIVAERIFRSVNILEK